MIEELAQFYTKSPLLRETETELEKLSGVQNYGSPSFKEITYVTTFWHQFRWIFWRSFRKLKRGITAFLITMITALMVTYSATSMILAIGIHENAASGKTLLVTSYFVFMLVFLGMSLNFETMAPQLSWLQYFSIPHYGYMALQHNEFFRGNFCPELNTTTSNKCPDYVICSGEEFLLMQDMDISPWGLWMNHVALSILMIIFLIIAYLRMLYLKRNS
ncbi:broad substrate specificity ATP-binding cassette transporter ABCG2-like [Callospermophilus lateralis]|uniref:broad substrate specificity ATP-binding cassette transporter ABCG2-like n=1 Tax=Callospermophilus lateralis TaxID=76772 RepID=UPI004038B6FF